MPYITFNVTLDKYTFPRTYTWDFAADVFVAVDPVPVDKSTINDPNIISPLGNLGHGYNPDGSIIWADESEAMR